VPQDLHICLNIWIKLVGLDANIVVVTIAYFRYDLNVSLAIEIGGFMTFLNIWEFVRIEGFIHK
jgi:hypothetical protein